MWDLPGDNADMDIALFLIDFILHVDRHLAEFVQQYGVWVYALLFLIIFVETGLVVMPFLPGDSLLFVVGALAGADKISLPVVIAVMLVAAILGDQTNYTIGRKVGPKVFQWENSRFFNKDAFNAAHAFYEKHGGITIILARFMPFVRTFAPFVAGVSEMNRTSFTIYNVVGAVIWVVGITLAGYAFGSLPWVQANLSKIIWGLILVPGLIALVGGWRARRAAQAGA
jgi:membrane-associated protein